MSLKDEIKSIIIGSGWTMTKVVKEFNKRTNSTLTLPNFSNKLRKETIRYSDILIIADIVGYKISWTAKR